ncbi:MAG: diphthamide biosynthesis enzyme Dph2 [Candidatus Bathyarchaeota archaeon]|nr:MAG: diphthamide biosynthesis enzyme Dph2 [Candidatus Bathyarchaeota archaeon]
MRKSHDLEQRRLAEKILKARAKFVLIQLPEGLKTYGPELAYSVENLGALAIVSADPCYGGCDLAISEAERLGADLLVHYGHTKMLEQKAFPTLYIEAKSRRPVKYAVTRALRLLQKWRRIGLITTAQHIQSLDEIRSLLVEKGKVVLIGDSGKLEHAGQVLGCDYSNALAISEDVECFLFVGGGRFHALGVSLATAKPTVVADPYEKKAFSMLEEVRVLLKKRWASIYEARKAEQIGVLIGLKTGQKRLDLAFRMKRMLENAKKRVTLFALREITPSTLMQFPTIHAFVNTACPRLSLDNAESFRKPLLTPNETLVALGKMSWEQLCQKGWFEN